MHVLPCTYSVGSVLITNHQSLITNHNTLCCVVLCCGYYQLDKELKKGGILDSPDSPLWATWSGTSSDGPGYAILRIYLFGTCILSGGVLGTDRMCCVVLCRVLSCCVVSCGLVWIQNQII